MDNIQKLEYFGVHQIRERKIQLSPDIIQKYVHVQNLAKLIYSNLKHNQFACFKQKKQKLVLNNPFEL